jgi:hypothetical protein
MGMPPIRVASDLWRETRTRFDQSGLRSTQQHQGQITFWYMIRLGRWINPIVIILFSWSPILSNRSPLLGTKIDNSTPYFPSPHRLRRMASFAKRAKSVSSQYTRNAGSEGCRTHERPHHSPPSPSRARLHALISCPPGFLPPHKCSIPFFCELEHLILLAKEPISES